MTKGIALVVVVVTIATMMIGAATMAVAQPTIDQSISQSLPSGDRERNIESNENSEKARVTQEINRDHDVKQAGAADEPALDMERTIETPNKNIEIDVESDDNSRASEQEVELEMELAVENSCC
jgi:hypothetical protein